MEAHENVVIMEVIINYWIGHCIGIFADNVEMVCGITQRKRTQVLLLENVPSCLLRVMHCLQQLLQHACVQKQVTGDTAMAAQCLLASGDIHCMALVPFWD